MKIVGTTKRVGFIMLLITICMMLSAESGEEMLKRAISTNPTNIWGKTKQKGQWISDNQNISAYLHGDDGMYFGNYLGNKKNGYGIYIVTEGRYISNCRYTKYFVGDWSNDIKNGTGTCYDASGKLIYYGEFKDDKPTGTYPTTGSYSSKKFETIDCTDGDKYIGETKDGKRDGYGVYAWKNGHIWIGIWKDGERAGKGIYIASDGSLTTGSWDKNTRTDNTVTVTTTTTTTTTTTKSGSSGGQSSGGQSSGFSQNPNGTTTFRMPGYESTMDPNTGYGTVTSTCAICSGTGQIRSINPMYGIGAANAISGGYANTTPMYTWQTCYLCNGLGKRTTTTYVAPNTSSSGSSSGSSSSSGGSSGYSSGSGSNSRSSSSTSSQSKCTFCKGKGKRFGDYTPNLTGTPKTMSWCSICEEDNYPHTHVSCSGCGGTGYR